MRTTGGDHISSAFLRVVVVGPSLARGSGASEHTTALVSSLRDAGHAVTLIPSWPRPRTPHAAWSAMARRLQDADAVLLVPGVTSVPGLFALTSALGALGRGRTTTEGRAAVVMVADAPLTVGHGPARRLTEALLRRCDAALVHDEVGARTATALGARRVCVVPLPAGAGESVTAQATRSPGTSTFTSARSSATSSATRPEEPAVVVGRGRTGRAPGRWPLVPAADRPGGHGHDPLEQDDELAQDDEPVLSAEWARYVGAIESLAAPLPPLPSFLPGESRHGAGRATGPAVTGEFSGGAAGSAGARGAAGGAATAGLHRARRAARALPARLLARARVAREVWGAGRPVVALARLDLPEWVVPTDVLLDPQEADDARRVASGLGLPRVGDATSAWAALGALAAVVRLVDDGRRSAVIVHESGHRTPGAATGRAGAVTASAAGSTHLTSRVSPDLTTDTSPFGRWAVAAGFAPVALGLTDPEPPLRDPELGLGLDLEVDLEMDPELDLDLGSLDAVVRIHPHGCDADDVEEALSQASWALRQGGILVLTVPVGSPGVAGALTPADLRGLVARAHDRGLTLVGDLDGDLTSRLSSAAAAAASSAAASSATASSAAPSAAAPSAAAAAASAAAASIVGTARAVGPAVRAPDTAYGLARLVLRRA